MAERGNDFKGRSKETSGRPTGNSAVDFDSKAQIAGSRAKRMVKGELHEAKGGASEIDEDLIEDDELIEVQAKEPRRKGNGKRTE